MSELNFAKVDDIAVGVKIGRYINGEVRFVGKITKITYDGVSFVNGHKYVGGKSTWSGHGDMSFSLNDGTNETIVLVE